MSKTDGTLRFEVRRLLRHGKGNARKGREIAEILGFRNDRMVRHAIRDMITEGLPIASTINPPFGYFIASSQEEATDYMKVLKSRLVNDAYRRRDFKIAARKILIPSQLELI